MGEIARFASISVSSPRANAYIMNYYPKDTSTKHLIPKGTLQISWNSSDFQHLGKCGCQVQKDQVEQKYIASGTLGGHL